MATAQNAAQKAAAQQAANNTFMGLSYEQPFAALAQNGNNYAPGSVLNFDAPVIPGGYLTRLVLTLSLTVNYTAAGASPTAALTAGGIWNAIQTINVKFGEQQISVHPYAEYVFSLMRGYGRVNGGVGQTVNNQVAGIQTQLYSAPTLNAGNNTWLMDIEIPLNSVHPASVNGILPLGQTGTKAQVQVIPASSFTGTDPLQNVVNTNGTITVSGTVKCTAMVRDYKSFATTQPVEPSLNGLATVQTIKPQEINPLTAGSYNFRTLSNPYPTVRWVIFLLDGLQSDKFSTAGNILGYELDQAENTNSAFFRHDDTTGGMSRYYAEIRRRFGQDMPEGVLVFDAPTMNQGNPSNMGGNNFLNLTSQGYPAARWGVKVNSVSSANFTPRAVMYSQIINPSGISLV